MSFGGPDTINAEMQVSICYLNCNRPSTKTEFPHRNLAKSVINACGGAPDILVLSEIEDENNLRLIVNFLQMQYNIEWCAAKRSNMTGLAILVNNNIAKITHKVSDLDQSKKLMPRWLACKVQFRHKPECSLWIIGNHWKAQIPTPQNTEYQRIGSAMDLNALFREWHIDHGDYVTVKSKVLDVTDNIVLIGDFNCEPGSKPFTHHESWVEYYRQRQIVVEKGAEAPCFYNPMYRLMCEPVPIERIDVADGFSSPNWISGSIRNNSDVPQMFDQVMFSSSLVQGVNFRILEESIRLFEPIFNCTDHHGLALSIIL